MTDLHSTNYSDGDVDTNASVLPTLNELANARFSRRQTMMRTAGATAMAFFGTSLLAACGDDDNEAPTVTAGADGSTSSGRLVTLTATASDDNAVSTAAWTQTAGETVKLVAGADNAVSFIAPSVAASTVLTFEFKATDDDGKSSTATTNITVAPAQLGFTAVAKNRNDIVTVPEGYTVTVMTRLGDPLATGVSAYANDGTDSGFDQRIGDHGDALAWFGLDASGSRADGSSTRGLLVQNHENITQAYLHAAGASLSAPRALADALKEIECHGLSVSEYKDAGNRAWSYVQGSTFNRRITPNTDMVFHGPAAGTAYLATPYSTNGSHGRGTINNCANGHTGWASVLTCEENWAGYFLRSGDDAQRSARELTALSRYGVTSSTGNYSWSTASTTDNRFTRWDARATVGGTATTDFRNEPNQFGWVVEIDPYDPASAPRKRTALGRFGHEGAWLGKLTAGKKVAVYMGDDSRREYLYKFVSTAAWDAADATAANRLAVGDKYLDAGTLYVAVFNADGTGTWKPLVFGSVPDRPAVGSFPAYTFADQADILVNTRLAADAVGATPMDRPEWTAVNPVTGEVYLTLTNNDASNRPLGGTDAANPRHYGDPKLDGSISYGNPNGHIIRLREDGDDTAAATFKWDIYLFGADSADSSPMNVNISGLTADNDFSSPDGCWFSRPSNAAGKVKPLLWIQTDDGAFTDRTNCMMLAALPGTVSDGGTKTITNVGTSGSATQATIVGTAATAANLRRFLTGPVQCEITGVDSTPDGRTLFVGIQHPGEEGNPAAITSHWPESQTSTTATSRPRSAVVAITKNDGGVVAL
ncbi:PhoX family protein [Novosphingobium colocasiae]|uniref:Phosphatase n=1 Tax=Novosphingobium colocasiae TaxID=1256513 RepID=A0A918PKN0_9SPHN|nr:PhoX family phosphatase [Novosphingobium colocasiae]GGZ12971.1 phosphatase [Novosphingobium colocasiae]